MGDRQRGEHVDHAETDPEPISGSGYGTPRPDTNLGTSDLAGVDPDFGLDPQVNAPGYGGTDRGRTEMGNYRTSHTGSGATSAGDVGGTLRGGDTTSNADSYSNLAHGLGEATAGVNMPQGVTSPAASDNPPGGEHISAPEPNDATAQTEGLQSTRSPQG